MFVIFGNRMFDEVLNKLKEGPERGHCLIIFRVLLNILKTKDDKELKKLINDLKIIVEYKDEE